MHINWIVLAIVLAMLCLERLLITRLTASAWGKAFCRSHWFMTPNGLSVMRLPMGVISILMAAEGWWITAMLWFSFWMITDMTDGTIARNCDLVTETGKWLDPLSDKCMYFPPLIYMSAGNVFPWGLKLLPFSLVAAFVILDILGQMSRLWVQKKAANSFGKAKTALVTIMLCIISLDRIHPLVFGDFTLLNARFMAFLMLFCTALAFMSFYCKVIPDIWYANSLIMLNCICGIGCVIISVIAVTHEHPDYYALAFSLVFLGQFFDLFDGRLAQKFGMTMSEDVFDEIADATNYGCGIASIVFCILAFQEVLIPWYAAIIIAAFYWVATLFNLFRYRHSNFTPTPGIFCGLPASAGAALTGSSVLVGLEFPQPYAGVLSSCGVVLACCLMLSRLPYRHFGLLIWKEQPRMVKLLVCLLGLLFIGLTLSHRPLRFILVCTSFVICLSYVLFGFNWKSRAKAP